MQALFGLGGLGGVLWYVGDLLFYGYFGSGAVSGPAMTDAIVGMPSKFLEISGLLGPLGAMCCLAGVVGLYRAARPGRLAGGICLLLALLFVFWGATHLLFAGRAIALHADRAAPASLAVVAYWAEVQGLLQLAAYPAAIGALVLVGLKRTRLPRWTALANFGLLTLAEPVARLLPAPLGAPIVAGFSNLAVAVWFAVSAAACPPAERDAPAA